MYNKCLILNQKCIGKFKSYDFTVSYIPNEKKITITCSDKKDVYLEWLRNRKLLNRKEN